MNKHGFQSGVVYYGVAWRSGAGWGGVRGVMWRRYDCLVGRVARHKLSERSMSCQGVCTSHCRCDLVGATVMQCDRCGSAFSLAQLKRDGTSVSASNIHEKRFLEKFYSVFSSPSLALVPQPPTGWL